MNKAVVNLGVKLVLVVLIIYLLMHYDTASIQYVYANF